MGLALTDCVNYLNWVHGSKVLGPLL